MKESLDLIFYYSGEGTTFRGEKVLIPYDADLKNEFSFFSLKKLYSNLIEIQKMEEVGEITLFMDVDFNNSAFQQYIVKPGDLVEDPKAKKKKRRKRKRKKVNLKRQLLNCLKRSCHRNQLQHSMHPI